MTRKGRGKQINWTAILGSKNHKEALERLLKEKGFVELEHELGVHECAIHSLACRVGAKYSPKKRGGHNKIDWEAKLKDYPGESIEGKATKLRQHWTTAELSKMLDVSGNTIRLFFHDTIPETYQTKELPHHQYVNYLKELKAFMATPGGELVRKYNEAVLKGHSTPSFHYLRSRNQ
jgi:hypothetical protein